MADVKLKIVEGSDVGREFEIAGALVVGRDPSAGIVVRDPEVSRRHAALSAVEDGIEIEDLGSTNGTFLNGERIDAKRTLGAGDKLRMGNTVLEVVPADAGEPERRAAAEEAVRHAEPELGDENLPTVVPDPPTNNASSAGGAGSIPAGRPTAAGAAAQGVPAPAPPPAFAAPAEQPKKRRFGLFRRK